LASWRFHLRWGIRLIPEEQRLDLIMRVGYRTAGRIGAPFAEAKP